MYSTLNRDIRVLQITNILALISHSMINLKVKIRYCETWNIFFKPIFLSNIMEKSTTFISDMLLNFSTLPTLLYMNESQQQQMRPTFILHCTKNALEWGLSGILPKLGHAILLWSLWCSLDHHALQSCHKIVWKILDICWI